MTTNGHRIRLLALLLVGATFATTQTAAAGRAGDAARAAPRLRALGPVRVRDLAVRARSALSPRARGRDGIARHLEHARPHHRAPRPGGEVAVPIPDRAVARVTHGHGGVMSFDGIDHADQRIARDGNQYTKEPPDGALCAGDGVIVQMVNAALQFSSTGGVLLSPPIALTSLWGLPPEVDRTRTPPTFPGPTLGDVKCVVDPGTNRLFLLAWGRGQNPTTGGFNGENTFFVAVSASSDLLGGYHRYAISASAPSGCPCEADHPTIATDASTLVVTYNEFASASGTLNGAKLLVMSKAKLEAGAVSPVASLDAGQLGGGPLYTLQGGNVPAGGRYETAGGGTLWFVSALEFTGEPDTRIALEALTNTSSIDTDPSAIRLLKVIVPGVLPYVVPPSAAQRPGPRPLGEAVGEPLPRLDSGSDETQPTKFAAGRLWTVIDTQVGSGRSARAGLLYLQVAPTLGDGSISGRVVRQGYLAIRNGSLLYGDVAVNAAGKALIVTSIVGPRIHPSAAYGLLRPGSGVGEFRIYREGMRPQDGATCYRAFVGKQATERGCRWGDYSEATVGGDGAFWFETEYVTSRLRTSLANWGTAIGRVPG